ncbi:MAG TPA: hypothetical protein PLI00_04530 [Pseudomonadota bacterium]|nr:hypothetical protein [Xanthomonadales bacterium]HQW63216.1 hypothetical protein [Pseudomonadota bacterium]MBP6692048.1 hypothetical protein [Xanthomonadales bacterium]MBP7418293.1 hypothetical protein [Xanthomonadales bacterium]MBP8176342.1 hypothetical protein [Xanthomonadales bacterium]
MTITLTLKQVPLPIAEGLRRRAAANRRSQQRELLLILERAVAGDQESRGRVAEPTAPSYADRSSTEDPGRSTRARGARKLGLEQLWQRARRLGATTPDESTAIVRRDRDARHGR